MALDVGVVNRAGLDAEQLCDFREWQRCDNHCDRCGHDSSKALLLAEPKYGLGPFPAADDCVLDHCGFSVHLWTLPTDQLHCPFHLINAETLQIMRVCVRFPVSA